MKLKPIKYPKKVSYIDTSSYSFKFIQDHYFLLIRVNKKFIEVGVCDKKSYILKRAYRGKDIVKLYRKIIKDNWVSRLEHAAYLGKELAHADDCLKNNKKYIQGKA